MKYVLGSLLAALLAVSVACAATDDGAELYAKSCKGCHGADGGKVAMGMQKAVKDLSQEEAKAALAGYQAGSFGGEKKAIMERVVKSLSDEQIDALAAYIASL